VWCICGHKQLSDGWTSNNKQLDEFIKKSQLQANSPNHAYLEWIPYDCIYDKGHYDKRLFVLPTCANTIDDIDEEDYIHLHLDPPIPISDNNNDNELVYLDGLPICANTKVKLIPFKITDETDYDKVNYLLMRHLY